MNLWKIPFTSGLHPVIMEAISRAGKDGFGMEKVRIGVVGVGRGSSMMRILPAVGEGEAGGSL